MRTVFIVFIFSILPACYSKLEVAERVQTVRMADVKDVYVINHNWHTGFIVPIKQISAHLPQLSERFGDAPFLEFGWGDKDFYQAKEITAWLIFKAAFFPTESTVHVVAVPENVCEYFPNSLIKRILMNNDAYSSLITFISNSFLKNGQSEILALKRGLYGNSQFYKGVGEFSLLNTCNKWTARGLQSAGVDITSVLNLTAGSIMNGIKEYKQGQSIETNKASNISEFCQ